MFGKLALSVGTLGAASLQRRRLALLALLAAPAERELSRDRLIAYLWPDSSAAHGRHSLDQQPSSMRLAFGDGVFTGVNPVCLNASVMRSDVNEFERWLSRGDLSEAVAIYDGPFLNGFYLENAPEFER